MINAIVNGIFNTIILLFNTIMTPIVNTILALFPDVATYFSFIDSFLDIGLTYVSIIMDLLLIPRGPVSLFFDYLLIKYTIHLTALAVKCVITIYNKLKP